MVLILETITKNINHFLKATNTTPRDLSKITGVSLTAVYSWLKGRYAPSIPNLFTIAASFPGVKVSNLVDECDDFWENYGKQ